MMKKIVLVICVLTMILSLAACGKKDSNTGTSGSANGGNSTGTTQVENAEDAGVGFTSDSEYVVFVVKNNFTLESDAWLGIIPDGTIYTKEVDADEYDIIYTYADSVEPDLKEYRFAFEKDYFESVEDGVYDMVLCSSDNEETGVVLLQFGIEKKGTKVTFDFKNK